MNYIIFDLESTCWEKEKQQSEIIEIGAVKLNDKLEEVDQFQSFVRPVINRTLSPFCTRLTTITQEQVDSADHSDVVIPKFFKWITDNGTTTYWLCSWGFYDKKMLAFECQKNNTSTLWLKYHISIKHQYKDLYKIAGGCGMPSALERFGLVLEGTHHRGIDDAINIAKVFKEIFPKLKF